MEANATTLSSQADTLLEVDGLSKRFCRTLKRSLFYGVQDVWRELGGRGLSGHDLRKNEFWANQNVSFSLRRGECVGLVGTNGAGKTTLLKILNGLIKPDEGEVRLYGRVGGIIALGAGFNPVLTGRENVMIAGSVLGLTNRELEEKYEEIVDFAEIGDFIDAPVQSYSSGMAVRLGFAVATALEPDILLLDEVLAVGDDNFRNKCFKRMGELQKKAGIIFVSHNLGLISLVCSRIVMLRKGQLVFDGSVEEGMRLYSQESSTANSPGPIHHPFIAPVENATVQAHTLQRAGDDYLKVDLHVQSSAAVENCELRILISEIAGHALADWHSKRHPARYSLKRGDNSIQLELGPLMLRPGRYTIDVYLMATDALTQNIYFQRIEPFQIEGKATGGFHHIIPGRAL